MKEKDAATILNEIRRQIQGASVSHKQNTDLMQKTPFLMGTTARKLGWTTEFLKGYQEGVQWVYGWFLAILNDKKKGGKQDAR